MIEVRTGNALTLAEGIFVHGCNCHGVMGAGIAKGVKDVWPSTYSTYRERYEKCGLHLGDVVVVASSEAVSAFPSVTRHLDRVSDDIKGRVIVVNAMTQYDMGNDPDTVYVDYGAVFAAFARVRLIANATGLPVNFPLIGCGLANGKWEQVEKAITLAMGDKHELVLWKLP